MNDCYKISFGENCIDYYASDSLNKEKTSDVCSDCYKIIFSLSHGGFWNVEGTEYNLVPGTLLLIAPLACHHIDLSELSDYECYTLLFSKSVLSDSILKLLDGMFDGEDAKSCFYPPEIMNLHISDLFNRFAIVNDLQDCERRIYFELLINELIVLLSAIKIDGITPSGDCLGARVIKYLNNNIQKNISLDKLARRFFVSKYHLCRAFKEYSGISVHSYINYKRIMYAKQLILSGHTASDAAEKVGFGDYSAFYRAYVKIVGKSPSAE